MAGDESVEKRTRGRETEREGRGHTLLSTTRGRVHAYERCCDQKYLTQSM